MMNEFGGKQKLTAHGAPVHVRCDRYLFLIHVAQRIVGLSSGITRIDLPDAIISYGRYKSVSVLLDYKLELLQRASSVAMS